MSSPWKVILATLVIFCSGLVTGGLMVKNFSHRDRPRSAANQQSSNPIPSLHQQQKDFLRRMEKELNLGADQMERIDAIFKASQERTKKIRDTIAPELKEEVKRLREEMRVELTPEQRKKFDEAIKIKAPKKGEKKDGGRKESTNTIPSKVP